MFDIGFWEICIIGIVGLLVIGPDRLPGVARTIGKYVGKAQRMVNGVKSDIRRELEAGELKDLLGEQKKQIEELQGLVSETKAEMESTTREAITSSEKSWTESLTTDSTTDSEKESSATDQSDNSIMHPESKDTGTDSDDSTRKTA